MLFKELKTKYPLFFPLVLITGIALIIRLLYLYYEQNNPLFLYPVIDETEFINTARILASNHFSYPEHYWHPPLYSWLLALLMKAGASLSVIVVFQQLLGIAGTLILYFTLRKLNPLAALISSLVWAVYPVQLFTETRFLSENLYIFLSLCLLYQLVNSEISLKKIVIIAVVTSLLIITKSQFVLFMLIFTAYLLFRTNKKPALAIVYLVISMLLPVVVSTGNTRKAEGNFIFVSSNGPTNLYIGNSSDINKTLNIRPYEWREKFYPGLYDEAGIRFTAPDSNEEEIYPYKLSGFLLKKTVSENIHLWVPVKNIFIKTFGLIYAQETPRNYDLYVYKQFNPVLNWGIWKLPVYFPLALLMYAALIYIFVRRKILKNKPWFWLLILLLVHLLPSLLVFNAFRYRLPAVPILIFFAVLFYTEYLRNYRLQLVNLFFILLFGTQLTAAFQIQEIPLYESYSTIAKAYLKNEKTEKAAIWFKKAQRNVPLTEAGNSYETYRGAAAAKEKSGDLQGALDEMNRAIEKNPRIADAFLYRASLLYQISEYKRAVEDYNQVLQLNTLDSNSIKMALYGRALAKAKLGDREGAENDFDSVIGLNPNYAEAYTNRGIIRAQLSNFNGAIKDFDRAIQLNPADEKPYFNKAGACGAMGDVQAALKNLNKSISLNPGYAQAYFMRGQIFAQIATKQQACDDFKKAYELGFTDAKQALDAFCR